MLKVLDSLSLPTFKHFKHTREVKVFGTWYEDYEELESELSAASIRSPAIRMLSIIVALLLQRTVSLKSFTCMAPLLDLAKHHY
jgi:hypothetical protein